MDKKYVLILCDLFPPAFGPRMGYLCKYLLLNGWNPVVITEAIEDNTFAFLAEHFQSNNMDITRIRYYSKKGWLGKLEWGCTLLRDWLYGYKDRRIYNEAFKKTEQYHFKIILCSTYRTFPLRAAARLAQKKGLPLIVDLRDIIEQYAGNEFITHPLPKIFGIDKFIAFLFRKKNISVRNHILQRACAVTTISPWHVAILKDYNANTQLINNGYDPELFFPCEKGTGKFYITYTGRLLSTAMRDPDLLFQAVQRLSEEGVIGPETFRIRWFVDTKSEKIITQTFGRYPEMATFMDFPGYVPASKIPCVLQESSILLLLTNQSTENGPKGVMTTKLFESLAVGKPILCVRGDEGCIEAVINRTSSGLSAHTVDEVYGFIKKHYLRWKAGLPYIDTSDRQEIETFSRERQAQQFIDIFTQHTTFCP